MKIALSSDDIHGNLPALEAVLADIKKQQPDELYCIGDLVNFAPWTNEVINLLRSLHIPVLQGNHDEGIGYHQDSFSFSFRSGPEREAGLRAIAYTNAVITDQNREYLKTLPHNIRIDSGKFTPYLHILLTHGSPENVDQYIQYDHDKQELLRLMDNYSADILCMGHTHKPYHRLLLTNQNNQNIYKHAINVGSVGKPKDGDVRAAWCMLESTEDSSIYNPESIQVQIHRVAYNLEQTVAAIRKSDIPDSYADLLLKA